MKGFVIKVVAVCGWSILGAVAAGAGNWIWNTFLEARVQKLVTHFKRTKQKQRFKVTAIKCIGGS